MHRIPPTFLMVTMTTNAAINTVTTTTLVAAPAAGSRIRVLALNLAPRPANTGAVEARCKDGAAGNVLAVAGLTAAGAGAHPEIAEPGVALTDATALVVDHLSNVAGQLFDAAVQYYVEFTS